MNLESRLSAFAVFTITMMVSWVASAYPSGPDGQPWKASADIVNSSSHSGIVVTDSTYAGCSTQFSNAMDSHAYNHGDIFDNIKYCSYNPFGPAVGVFVEKEAAKDDLDTQISDLEADFDIARFISLRNKIIRLYRKQIKQIEKPAEVGRVDKVDRVVR